MNIENAKKAACNLYAATRELPMKAADHQLMGTSHEVLQQLIIEAEKNAGLLTQKEERIQFLKNEVWKLSATEAKP